MQRLTTGKNDRGAVAVWVALLLIPFMGVAALAVDIGAAHADRQRLQIGADAAALAVAQDCAMGACGDVDATAQALATANDPFGGPATGDVTDQSDLAAGYVHVETTSERDYWFAPAVATAMADVEPFAESAATWGPPSGGRSAIPFAFAACEMSGFGILELDAAGDPVGLNESAVGQRFKLEQSKVTNTADCPTKPQSGNWAPGGFGWLAPDGEAGEEPCSVQTEIGQPVDSANGNAQGNHDSPCYLALRNAIDRADADPSAAALLPVFRSNTAESINDPKTYLVVGYVAVTLEGYHFQGNRCYGESVTGGSACAASAGGNGGWIVIEPQRYIANDEDFETSPTAPDLGSAVVTLTLPREG
ncbi:pilus assembly protein TadG-related protein [Agrococcus sp. HG114]|uniref:pilus assembly protein TadG-related protein n=1 Tax=Agrococcus sp. HG114 TaxID=2969757 RepID=UPI00215B5D4F|nr:pilus assembly protein TadG-related protein [Agrococcus sp. HG114]MCR8670696.1 pilus assembly protein TadG-related protein [Agrococcus sp. HG114]